MVYGAIAQIARPFIKQIGRNIYQALRAQDRIIDYTYRKTGLYNRGVVRGIKHGLGGGAIVGGTFQLGLNAPDSPGNDIGIPQQRNGPSARTSYKTRSRFPRCYSPRSKFRPSAYSQRRRTGYFSSRKR